MAISSQANSDYLAVKVFLYKYTPDYTFIPDQITKSAQLAQVEGQAPTDPKSVSTFNTMLSAVENIITLTEQILSNPIINGSELLSLDTDNFIPQDDAGDEIGLLKDKYKNLIPAGGQYIFPRSGFSTDPASQVAVVTKNLNLTGVQSQDIARLITVPEEGFVLKFNSISQVSFRVALDVYPFPRSPGNGVIPELIYPIFKAWMVHARQLNANMKVLRGYKAKINSQASSTPTAKVAFHEQVENSNKVIQYKAELDASKYFSKFDVTRYVKSYSFNQEMKGITYDWSVDFQDAIISFSDLAPTGTALVRKVSIFKDGNGKIVTVAPGPACRQEGSASGATDLVYLMALSDSETTYPTTLDREVATIAAAYVQRGTPTIPYQSSGGGAQPGLRLSDLVQKYNFISVFVYKAPISFAQAKQATFPKGVPTSSGTFETFDESNEVHLMLAGFRNEFNGFVVDKSWNRTVGQVDQVSVKGNGILRLFSDTLTMYDPSVLAAGVYDGGVLEEVSAGSQRLSVFQNLFAGLDPIQIIGRLLDLVYKISFTAKGTPVVNDFNSSNTEFGLEEFQGFYNLYRLAFKHGLPNNPLSGEPNFIYSSETGNSFGNLFLVSPALLAYVMALRNFNYNIASSDAGDDFLGYILVQNASSTSVGSDNTYRPDTIFREANVQAVVSTQFAEEFGGPCAQITQIVQQFNPYFTMLKTGWENYISSLKTPREVIDEVLKFSMLEFFERPNGRILLRTPQYNQIARITSQGEVDHGGNLITSDELNLISAHYNESGAGIKSQLRGSWASSLAGTIGGGLIQPAYGNGKLLIQYGVREDLVEANPAFDPLANSRQAAKGGANINLLVHQYLRFLMEWDNAGLRVGSVTMEGDPSIEVGKLFFDRTNSKIGYIVGVTKELVVGGAYTTSISLKFVRDAASFTDFRALPTLEELVTSASGDILVGEPSIPIMEFSSLPDPPVTSQTLQQIGQQLATGLSGPIL